MIQPAQRKRFNRLSLCCLFLSALTLLHSLGAEPPKAISGSEIDRSVIASLLHQGVTKPVVISHIDLTKSFETETQWTFVTVQEGGQPSAPIEDNGPILICLVKETTPDCAEDFYQHVSGEPPWAHTPYHLLSSGVVYASRNRSNPLLLVKVCGAESFDADCGIATALYKYDRQGDRFIRVFLNVTGRNNNQATHFVESGPLQGDVIVDYPTEHAPFTYWIEVYRTEKSGQYVQILRYRGHTGYGDGNPLFVSDSEMPAILSHLGLWKPGNALPVPAHVPKECGDLFMRDGEEWCKLTSHAR